MGGPRKPFLHRASSYEELWAEVDFRTFPIPDPFNLGVACVDDQDPDATALVLVAKDESHVTYTFGDVRGQANRLANAVVDMKAQLTILNPGAFVSVSENRTISI